MTKRVLLVMFLFVVVASSAQAQTTLPCVKLPFQVAGHGNVVPPGSAQSLHVVVPITLPASPVEIEHVTAHGHNTSGNTIYIGGLKVSTQLYGQTIAHSMEMHAQTAYGFEGLLVSPNFSGVVDWSHQVKLYADASSVLGFNIDIYFSDASVSPPFVLDVTATGRAVTPGCWIGPQ